MNISEDEINNMFMEAKQFISKETKKEENCDLNGCVSCGKQSLLEDYSHGIIVCTSCGVINHDQIIDQGAEWNFGAEEAASGGKDPSRCGMPVNEFFQKSSCSTFIGGPSHKNYLYEEITCTNESMDYVERSRYHMFVKIGRMCDSIKSPVCS